MLKKVLLFLLASFFLFLASRQANDGSYFFFIWIPAAFIIFLFSISNSDLVPALLIALLSLFPLYSVFEIFGILTTVLLGCVFLFSFLLWLYLLQEWRQSVVMAESQKEKIRNDIDLLRKKFDARIDSLKHLEKQVGGLLNLFEVARDFNECLHLDDLIGILDKKVRSEIPFQSISLLITSGQKEGKQTIQKVFSLGAEGILKKGDQSASEFDRFCLDQMDGEKRIVRFEGPERLAGSDSVAATIHYPLWIFSLSVDDRMISVMAISGAAADDFPKVELLASQLALQIKKIGLYETVKELSIIDGLTKTYVRRHFLERFEEELKRANRRNNPLSVLILDIDHFKSYNDTFGHLVGDSALREVVAVVRSHVRKVDLVSRYGGEEFAIVMPDIERPANIETAERIRSAIARKKFQLYDEETKVTVSIGISTFPKDLDKKNTTEYESVMLELLHKADKALYRAKEEGRNRVVSYDQLQ